MKFPIKHAEKKPNNKPPQSIKKTLKGTPFLLFPQAQLQYMLNFSSSTPFLVSPPLVFTTHHTQSLLVPSAK